MNIILSMMGRIAILSHWGFYQLEMEEESHDNVDGENIRTF